jgi:maltose O-acetyltransferase
MVKLRISILYSWFIRIITFWLPDHPVFMRFRGWLYSAMMNRCGCDFQVASTVILNSLAGLKTGNHVYIAYNTVIIGTDITIEDEVIIGPNCVISGGNHTFAGKSFRFATSMSSPVILSKGSWMAGNCSIVAGSVLPPCSILAAGSVLTCKQDKSYGVYAGIPARYIKEINVKK